VLICTESSPIGPEFDDMVEAVGLFRGLVDIISDIYTILLLACAGVSGDGQCMEADDLSKIPTRVIQMFANKCRLIRS